MLSNLFEQTSEKYYRQIALENSDHSFTYSDLNKAANKVAHYLVAENIKPGDVIALHILNSFETIIFMIGIWKAGGIYVPLDISNPANRLKYILDDCKPKLIISDDLHINNPIFKECNTLTIRSEKLKTQPEHNIKIINKTNEIAYIIYTSGTTGFPKGVVISHLNLLSLFNTTKKYFKFNQEQIWLLFHSCAFDFSMWEILGAILHGGKLVIYPRKELLKRDIYQKVVLQHKINVINLTPSAYSTVCSEDFIHILQQKNPINHVIFGGEKLNLPILAPWFKENDSRTKIWNMYGLTELTIHATIHKLNKNNIHTRQSIIGSVLENNHYCIVDDKMNLVGNYRIGELLLGGSGLCREYLNMPNLNKEKFTTLSNEKRYYRTGDLVRKLANNTLEYIGRADSQIKLNGYRIELGEIESVLSNHPKILHAHISLQKISESTTCLIAYFVNRPQYAPPSSTDLETYVKTNLPDYMQPNVFIRINELPLTTNGKIDSSRLPKSI